jgi:hypothetical protein
VLLSAGVEMEVCRVVERGDDVASAKSAKQTPKSVSKKRKVEIITLSDSEDEDRSRSLSRPLADATASTCNKKTKTSN